MTFHEKTRWIALIATLMIWGAYFLQFMMRWHDGTITGTSSFWGMVLAVVWALIIQIVATAAIAIHRPKEALARPDEREQGIRAQAASQAYTLLSVGIVTLIVASFFVLDHLATMNLLALLFIAVECVRYALEIRAYRHGYA